LKVASVNEIKNELKTMAAQDLAEICLRLARFKKENKELLNYLLFESRDEQGYLREAKNDITEQFNEVNQSNLYFAKKTIRKILRLTNRYIKYTASSDTEIELLFHFCITLRESGIPFHKSTALNNLYLAQVKKINKIIGSLHEDLQYDYLKMMRVLED